ncbi:hypothetical protein PG991_006293 [Apiospora marii]|uniref:Uncharacterized protein n=1 Tax=Apiospora marii TaxID=335849 RepID=A0ABR1SBN4_9PEZI
MDVPKLPSSNLPASPEDLDEVGDWAPTDWTADPATKTIASYVTKWFPPGDAYGHRLHRIILADDADALERYLKKFHPRQPRGPPGAAEVRRLRLPLRPRVGGARARRGLGLLSRRAGDARPDPAPHRPRRRRRCQRAVRRLRGRGHRQQHPAPHRHPTPQRGGGSDPPGTARGPRHGTGAGQPRQAAAALPRQRDRLPPAPPCTSSVARAPVGRAPGHRDGQGAAAAQRPRGAGPGRQNPLLLGRRVLRPGRQPRIRRGAVGRRPALPSRSGGQPGGEGPPRQHGPGAHGPGEALGPPCGPPRTLHHALWLGEKVDTVRFLLDHGASPGAANDEGDTPVHMVFEKLRYLIREFRPLRDDSSEREKWEQQWIKDGEENLRRILGLFLGPAGARRRSSTSRTGQAGHRGT